MAYPIGDIRDAVSTLSRGRLLVLINDIAAPGRCRVDMILAAELAQPSPMSTLVRFTSGFVNVALPRERCAVLVLPALEWSEDTHPRPVAAVAVDAAEGITTGISATDRATTARLLADPSSTAKDFNRPGHVVPLRVPEGALRAHSVVALEVELCRLAGLAPAVVRAEMVNNRGELLDIHDAPRVSGAIQVVALSARHAMHELGIESLDAPLAGGEFRAV